MKAFIIIYWLLVWFLILGCNAQLHYNGYYGNAIYWLILFGVNMGQGWFKNILYKAFGFYY